MTEPPRRPGHDERPRMPRWVKVPAIIIGILIVVFLILQITGFGGEHGPGRHLRGGGSVSAGVANVHPSPGIENRG
ncbi:hypothetical protein NQK81_28405 [Amycolatopsis roodepoortensis]|uniref:hypothetical protein n=1 Tax=Amycolatopsis roodepoortensis TaxID=700274 RepID=UPI00214C04EB|nr:hypothetical protein [Amycolatopsis roodepoortensis]UUV28691.1 hypothetical protein NQK81_28405 [Amycolatopsis roodepoortensis]